MKPTKYLGSATLALTLAVGAYAAANMQSVTEPKFGFKIDIPAGWQYGQLQNMAMAHIATRAPDYDASGANCVAIAEEIAVTKGATQAQLNESLKTPVGRDFWKSQVFGSFDKVEFESDGTRMHAAGIVVQEATVSGEVKANGQTSSRKVTSTIWITPGVTYSLACGARLERFNDFRSAFAAVAESFRTKDTANLTSASSNPALSPAATPVSLLHPSAMFGSASAVTALGQGPLVKAQ